LKKYTVYGEAKVRVSCTVFARDDEEVSFEKLKKRANRKFGGVSFLDGNGHMRSVGVNGEGETISPRREPIHWYDYDEEVEQLW